MHDGTDVLSNETLVDRAQLDYVSHEVKIAQAVVYLVIALMGCVGNSLTILATALCKKLWSIPNIYVVTLAIADFLVCSVIIVTQIYYLIMDRNIPDSVCKVLGPINVYLLALSMLSLAHIAVNRYILIVRSRYLYSDIYTKRNTIITIIITIIYGNVIYIPGALGFGEFGYNEKLMGCNFSSYNMHSYYFLVSIMMGCCLVPCIATSCVCYILILKHFKKSRSKIKNHATKAETAKESEPTTSSHHQQSVPTTSSAIGKAVGSQTAVLPFKTQEGALPIRVDSSSDINDVTIDQNTKAINDDSLRTAMSEDEERARKKTTNSIESAQGDDNKTGAYLSVSTDQKYTKASVVHQSVKSSNTRRIVTNLMAVFCLFLVCWAPVAGLCLVDVNNTVPAIYYSFLMVIAYGNSSVNVFLYAGMNKKFREAYTNILKCKWKSV